LRCGSALGFHYGEDILLELMPQELARGEEGRDEVHEKRPVHIIIRIDA
jgi:hypothetical protein